MTNDHETRRLAALYRTGALSGSADRFAPVCKLACRLFGVPMASISFVGAHVVTHVAREGFSRPTTTRSDCLCGRVIQHDEVTLLSDLGADADWITPRGAMLRFFAGAPIALEPDLRLGALCVYDTQPRVFGLADRETLLLLASVASTELKLPGQPG